ncbi:MAG: DUF192 domain-containing protein [Eubacteriales bacterium]
MDKVNIAQSVFSRFKGLIGKKGLLPGEGLIIKPCKQVHTFYMRFPLDILFVDKKMQILHIETLEPGKVGKFVSKAHFVLEVPVGTANDFGIFTGDYLKIEQLI